MQSRNKDYVILEAECLNDLEEIKDNLQRKILNPFGNSLELIILFNNEQQKERFEQAINELNTYLNAITKRKVSIYISQTKSKLTSYASSFQTALRKIKKENKNGIKINIQYYQFSSLDLQSPEGIFHTFSENCKKLFTLTFTRFSYSKKENKIKNEFGDAIFIHYSAEPKETSSTPMMVKALKFIKDNSITNEKLINLVYFTVHDDRMLNLIAKINTVGKNHLNLIYHRETLLILLDRMKEVILEQGEYAFLQKIKKEKPTEKKEKKEKEKEKEGEKGEERNIDTFKYALVVGILTQTFQAENEKYLKARGKAKQNVSFEMELNSQQENERYHFPRMLGLTLQAVQDQSLPAANFNERIYAIAKKPSGEVTQNYAAWEEQTFKKLIFEAHEDALTNLSFNCHVSGYNLARLLQDPSRLDDYYFVKQMLPDEMRFISRKDFQDSIYTTQLYPNQNDELIFRSDLYMPNYFQLKKRLLEHKPTHILLDKYQKIADLRKMIYDATITYNTLGRAAHSEDFKRLLTTLEKISIKSQWTYEQRYQEMVKEISKAYEKEKKHHFYLPFLTRNWKIKPNKNQEDSDFINHLNQNKNSYHYPRMLACILNKVKISNAASEKPDQRVSTYASHADIDQIETNEDQYQFMSQQSKGK